MARKYVYRQLLRNKAVMGFIRTQSDMNQVVLGLPLFNRKSEFECQIRKMPVECHYIWGLNLGYRNGHDPAVLKAWPYASEHINCKFNDRDQEVLGRK